MTDEEYRGYVLGPPIQQDLMNKFRRWFSSQRPSPDQDVPRTGRVDEQLAAWIIAHRLLLTYLVKAVQHAIPMEADPDAIDATATWLHNSIKPLLRGLPPDLATRVEALAQAEIDRILTAQSRDLPPPGQ